MTHVFSKTTLNKIIHYYGRFFSDIDYEVLVKIEKNL